jgi:hypothetical protein
MGMIRWHWNTENVAHIARHGVSQSEVEAVFASSPIIGATDRPGRWMAEGAGPRGYLRVIFAMPGPQGVFVITAYRIHPRRTATEPKP